MGDSVLDTVRAAYRTGLCILPATEDGEKKPAVSTWHEFTIARPTAGQMREWRFETRSGFGIIGGPVSGHVAPIDFDCAATYAAFIDRAQHCGLEDLVCRFADGYEDETPRGGRRWLVRLPPDVEFKDCTLAQRPGQDGEPERFTLIEIPTFAILAPSNGRVHPSGKPYIHLTGGFDTIASCTAEEWEAFLDYARSFHQLPRRDAFTVPPATGSSGLRPGDDFNRRTTWRSLLESRGWMPVYTRDGEAYWRRPGKSVGVSATTNYRGSDRLVVFST